MPDLLPENEPAITVGQMMQFAGCFCMGCDGVLNSDASKMLVFRPPRNLRSSIQALAAIDCISRVTRAKFSMRVFQAMACAVSVGEDDTLRVWNALSGAELHKFGCG